MAVSEEDIRELVDRLRELPPERFAQVRDFIEFLRQRERGAEKGHREAGSKADALNAIALRCASLPLLDERSDDEILGYDAGGLPETLESAGDSVDSMDSQHRGRCLVRAAARMAEPGFQMVWNNPDDDAYDEL